MKFPTHTQHKNDKKLIKDIEYSIKREKKLSNLNAKQLDKYKEQIEERKQEKEPIIYRLQDRDVVLGSEVKQIIEENKGIKHRNISNTSVFFRLPKSEIGNYVVHNDKMVYVSKTSFYDAYCLIPSRKVQERKYKVYFFKYKRFFENLNKVEYAQERYQSHFKTWQKLKKIKETQNINLRKEKNE